MAKGQKRTRFTDIADWTPIATCVREDYKWQKWRTVKDKDMFLHISAVSSPQYPVALYIYPPLADMFIPTQTQLLLEAF